MSAVYTCPPRVPEATQSTTVCIKFVPPVSGLLSSVEAQTSTTCASTSVVSGPPSSTGLHMLHDINLCGIFECAHLKFTVSGRSKQASKHSQIHTCVRNAVTLVWGSLRLAPTNLLEYPYLFERVWRKMF